MNSRVSQLFAEYKRRPTSELVPLANGDLCDLYDRFKISITGEDYLNSLLG